MCNTAWGCGYTVFEVESSIPMNQPVPLLPEERKVE